jgi:hypothetical protein
VDKNSPFYVPPLLHLLGGWVHNHQHFWLMLGRLESHVLAAELSRVSLSRPIYICGLARSGSTLLHEVVASHPAVATHRVKDYPLVFTPYWWRQATGRHPPAPPRERAHGDRVWITAESPDAVEEMIWMAFFPKCHDPAVNNELGAKVRHPAFEVFYRTHLRKMLFAERATRYAAKANYHVARLGYLQHLFPDARFLIPVRDPVSHITSLLRQQQRFAAGQRRFPRALAQMRRAGHFEFGRDRRPMNLGDTERVRAIQRAWVHGDEVRGWALYWAMVHDYLADQLATDASLQSAALVVRFEALCDAPADVLGSVFRHCALPDPEPLLEQFTPRVRRPDYYSSPLTAADVALIRAETAGAAARWGFA